jgi:ankyrin repeat protein
VDIIRALHGHGAGVTAADSEGRSPLHYAAEAGSEAAVELLLSQAVRADPLQLDRRGRSAVHAAAAAGKERCVALLAKLGLPATAADLRGVTPLHLAVLHGHAGAVSTLKDLGADVLAEDSEGDSPLHVAARSGNDHAIQLLLSHNTERGRVNRAGQTAYQVALAAHNPKCAQLLASVQVAQIPVRAITDPTAELFFAISNQSELSRVEAAISAGADVNALSSSNVGPLALAMEHGYLQVIPLLVKAGADVKVLSEHDRDRLIVHFSQIDTDFVVKIARGSITQGRVANASPTALKMANLLGLVHPRFLPNAMMAWVSTTRLRVEVLDMICPGRALPPEWAETRPSTLAEVVSDTARLFCPPAAIISAIEKAEAAALQDKLFVWRRFKRLAGITFTTSTRREPTCPRIQPQSRGGGPPLFRSRWVHLPSKWRISGFSSSRPPTALPLLQPSPWPPSRPQPPRSPARIGGGPRRPPPVPRWRCRWTRSRPRSRPETSPASSSSSPPWVPAMPSTLSLCSP